MDDAAKQHLFLQLHEEALAEPIRYFSHDADAFGDDALFAVFEDWGYVGYGMFWHLAEILHNKKGHTYDVSRGYGRLAHEMFVEPETIERFVASLDANGLLVDGLLERGRVAMNRVEKNAKEYADKVAPSRLGAAVTNAKRRA